MKLRQLVTILAVLGSLQILVGCSADEITLPSPQDQVIEKEEKGEAQIEETTSKNEVLADERPNGSEDELVEEEPSVIPPQSGAVAVYYAAYGGGSSSTVSAPDGTTITVKSSGGVVLRYLPGLNQSVVVDEFFSPDYSRNSLVPYTVDGRLFLVENWQDSRRAVFNELDPLSNLRLESTSDVEHGSNYSSWSTYAIVGDKLYYQTKRHFDAFKGDTGGDLRIRDLKTGSDTFLLDYEDQNNHGQFHSGGGTMYRIQIKEESQMIEINRLDLTTGKIARSLEFPIDNFLAYKSWQFAVDQDAIYIAAQKKATPIIDIWRLPKVAYEEVDVLNLWVTGLVHSHTLLDVKASLSGLDADQGHLVVQLFPWGAPYFVLYDHDKGLATVVETGGSVPVSMQILKLR